MKDDERRLERAAQKLAKILIAQRGLELSRSFAAAERSWKKRDSLGWLLWRRVESILKEQP